MARTARHLIAQAEYRHQRQAQAHGRGWLRWVNRVVYAAMLALSLLVYGGAWAGALSGQTVLPAHEALSASLPVLLLLVVGMQLVLIFRTLAAAAHSISREARGATWDVLVLTGVAGWQIVVAKWWATLRAQWRGWLLLVPVRVGLATLYAAVIGEASAWYMLHDQPSKTVVPPSPLGLLLIIPLVLAFTVANAAVMAAIGVLASAFARRGGVAVAFAVAIMIGLLVGTVLLGVGATRINYDSYQVSNDAEAYAAYSFRVQLLSSMLLTGLDNGTLLVTPLVSERLMQLPAEPAQMLFEIDSTLAAHSDYVRVLPLVVFLSMLLGTVLLGSLLWLARAAVGRRGALASPR